jgi:hypothetical protein
MRFPKRMPEAMPQKAAFPPALSASSNPLVPARQARSEALICCIAGQALMVWSLRRDIAWHGLKPFVVGAAIGLPIVPSWP